MERTFVSYDADRSRAEFTENPNTGELYFISPFLSGFRGVDQGRAYIFRAEHPRGGAVFVHGMGETHIKRLLWYGKKLAENGYTTVVPVLPFFLDRKEPAGEASGFMQGRSDQLERKYYQAVNDIFACFDFLEQDLVRTVPLDDMPSGTGNHTDRLPLHIVGMSLGGMFATIAMALDSRISRGALLITGGNFEHLTWKSIATKVFRVRYEEDDSCNPERCAEIHQEFVRLSYQFASRFSQQRDLGMLLEYPSCFRYDPSFFAPLIDPKRVLMISARFDPFIPRQASDDLWKRLNRPERKMLLSGHLTAHLFYKKLIVKQIINFLRGGKDAK